MDEKPAPFRRVDDWKKTSPITLPLNDYAMICKVLGYKTADVMSVRMNDRECIVTFHDPGNRGMPTSCRHEVVWK